MTFNEDDKAIYSPSNDLIHKSEAIQAIAEHEMYGAQMEYPGTASEDIEDWKEIGEMVLKDVRIVEAMPEFTDNDRVARHYINGMVAMNERAFQKLQAAQPHYGEWKELGHNRVRCMACRHTIFWHSGGAYKWPAFCPNCGADMRKKEKKHEERTSTEQPIRAQKARKAE